MQILLNSLPWYSIYNDIQQTLRSFLLGLRKVNNKRLCPHNIHLNKSPTMLHPVTQNNLNFYYTQKWHSKVQPVQTYFYSLGKYKSR